jgi:hypothetical protein
VHQSNLLNFKKSSCVMILDVRRSEMSYIMSDVAIAGAAIKAALSETAKQTNALAVGLQNAAPTAHLTTPNDSIQYLFAISDCLMNAVEECDKLLDAANEEQKKAKP